MRSSEQNVPEAVQDRSRATQQRILVAGMRIVESAGIDALTVAAVAADAGVAVGSVYRRFGDKEGLLTSVVERFTHDFRAELTDRLLAVQSIPAPSPAELVDTAVRALALTCRSRAPLLRAFMLRGTRDERVSHEGIVASHDGGETFCRFLQPVTPYLHDPADATAIPNCYRYVYAVAAHRVIFGEAFELPGPWAWATVVDDLSVAMQRFLLHPDPQSREHRHASGT